MNSLTWTFLIGCTVLLFTAQRAEGIKCYTCAGSGCEDEFQSENAQVLVDDNCSGTCTKLKVGDLVTRACSPIKVSTDCDEKDDNYACYCNDDLCNGSTTVVASALVMGTFAAVALMLKKF